MKHTDDLREAFQPCRSLFGELLADGLPDVEDEVRSDETYDPETEPKPRSPPGADSDESVLLTETAGSVLRERRAVMQSYRALYTRLAAIVST